MKKQTFFPRNVPKQDIALISTMGLNGSTGEYSHHPAWSEERRGKDWSWRQVNRHRTFSLVASESYRAAADATQYTRWEGYIKVNFRLRGRHTTILDGFGQEEHERPEAYITCSPPETLKVDVLNAGTAHAVALCMLPEFFPEQMGLSLEDLPEPLRSIALAETRTYAFHRFKLTPELMIAARSILAAPVSLRNQPAYSQAKAVELMCLLMQGMAADQGTSWPGSPGHGGRKARLHEARELLLRRYAEDITLDDVCREVGLNRTALTFGFRQVFGVTVYDFLQKERMERAYKLLQEGERTVAQVAEAVGYAHPCTFSTAFNSYFGCSPRKVRAGQR